MFGAVSRVGRTLYLQATPDRKKATLQSIIYKYSERGSTIMSDALSSYYSLERDFDYFRINKKVEGFAREVELSDGSTLSVTCDDTG